MCSILVCKTVKASQSAVFIAGCLRTAESHSNIAMQTSDKGVIAVDVHMVKVGVVIGEQGTFSVGCCVGCCVLNNLRDL